MSDPALSGDSESETPPVGEASGSVVNLKGVGNHVLIELDPHAPFERLRDEVRRQIGESPNRFKGATARLAYGARELTLFDLRRMVHLLKDEFDVRVAGLHLTPEALHRWAEVELKLKVYLTDAEEPDEGPDEDIGDEPTAGQAAEAPTAPVLAVELPEPRANLLPVRADPSAPAEVPGTHRMFPVERTVRSGTTVRFHGDIVVYGDVNAGGQVVATGNVLVLGRTSGLVHAGSDGDERAVIIGFDLRPTQVRIGNKIAIAPDLAKGPPRKQALPEIAWVSGDTIVIEEYRGRLPG